MDTNQLLIFAFLLSFLLIVVNVIWLRIQLWSQGRSGSHITVIQTPRPDGGDIGGGCLLVFAILTALTSAVLLLLYLSN